MERSFQYWGLGVLAIVVAVIAPAQETVNYASVTGRVMDSGGGALEGAMVTAREIETNITGSAKTDRDGRFRFPYLRVGRYELTVHMDGFVDATRRLTLTLGAAFDVPVTLAVGPTRTAVIVTGEPPVLEAARSQIAGTISRAEVDSLPLNGRNFLDLALLVPGVSPTNTASTQLFAETSAVPGQGLSVGSQRNFSNNFIVDGLSANDDAAGLSGVFYGLDVVREFQVVTSGGQAELGRALGGYVNMVTKSGTNVLHGDVYGYLRNQRLNAANPIAHIRLPLTQMQYGASLGGPVIRDRTFYFANFEQRMLNQAGLTTISPANVDAINARLAALGYQGSAVTTGLYPNPVHNSNFLAKMDHQFTARDQFSARYSLYDVHSLNSRGAGGLSAPSASANLNDTDQTLAAGNIAILSSHMVNETRAQFTNSNLQAPPVDSAGPAVSIAGVAAFGRLSGSPTARLDKLYEAVDNLSYQSGSHALRAGIDFLYNDCRITFPRSNRGSYSFSSLSNFLAGTYNNSGFTQTFGNSLVTQTNPNVGFYVQDEWQVGPRLTLNAGLRYDLQFLQSIATDAGNVAPRLGLAWSPFDSRRTIVRASFGIFYDRIPLRALANALLSAGNTIDLGRLNQVSLSLSPGQTGAPLFPAMLAAPVPAVTLANLSTMNPHIENAYSEQGSFEIEHQLGEHGTVTVGYEHLRGLHLIASVNQNVPACTPLGSNNGCRPNPDYGNNSQYSSLADSHYDGLHVSLTERPVKWGSYRISYTYSKALDNVGEFFFSAPIDNFNIWRDYGRSDDDQRHRVTLDGTARLSHGFELSGFLQYYSALPFNVASGANTIQGTAARPVVNGAFIGRNTGSGFDYFSVSARLSRCFRIGDRLRLEGMIEAFNALNHLNGVALNGTFGSGAYPANPAPGFRQVTAAADPRSAQVGLRLRF
jgi:outer membrane receptor protein involved in Fe transport